MPPIPTDHWLNTQPSSPPAGEVLLATAVDYAALEFEPISEEFGALLRRDLCEEWSEICEGLGFFLRLARVLMLKSKPELIEASSRMQKDAAQTMPGESLLTEVLVKLPEYRALLLSWAELLDAAWIRQMSGASIGVGEEGEGLAENLLRAVSGRQGYPRGSEVEAQNKAHERGVAAAIKDAIAADPDIDPVLAIASLADAEANRMAKVHGDDGDDACDRFCTAQSFLGSALATTVPGLRAHLVQFQRFVEDFDQGPRGAGHVAARHAAAIEKGIADGVTPATLPELQRHLAAIGELVEGFDDDGTCIDWYSNIVEGFEALVASQIA